MSSLHASAPAKPGLHDYARRVSSHYRGGIAVATLVTLLLALRFTLLASGQFESRVALRSAADGAAEVEAEVRRALPDLAAAERAGSLFVHERAGELSIACRAERAFAAHQRCSSLAGRALRAVPKLRIAAPATLPAEPLAKASSTHAVVALGSLVFGLLSGALWMLGMAALPSGRQRRPARSLVPAPHAPHALARVLTVDSPDPSAGERRPLGHASQPPSESAPLHAVDAERGWSPDPQLLASEAPPDLMQLCNRLYLAAAQQCFVLGVTSFDDQRSAKSRLAAQVAQLLARSQQARVLLLELDFHFASVDRMMRVEMPPRSGFSQQLHTRLMAGERTAFTVVRCTPHLSVLGEGRVRTPGMLHAYPVESALVALRRHFDIIVADGPTCEIEADRRVFSDVVDGVLFVAPAHASDSAALALATPRFDKGRLLAVVA
jgi:Mrp family chromosome partitioning ATPase